MTVWPPIARCVLFITQAGSSPPKYAAAAIDFLVPNVK